MKVSAVLLYDTNVEVNRMVESSVGCKLSMCDVVGRIIDWVDTLSDRDIFENDELNRDSSVSLATVLNSLLVDNVSNTVDAVVFISEIFMNVDDSTGELKSRVSLELFLSKKDCDVAVVDGNNVAGDIALDPKLPVDVTAGKGELDGWTRSKLVLNVEGTVLYSNFSVEVTVQKGELKSDEGPWIELIVSGIVDDAKPPVELEYGTLNNELFFEVMINVSEAEDSE